MSVISPSSIDINNDQLELTSKGLINNEKLVYIKMLNVSITFAGDNKQFEPDPNKVKKYIKFTTNSIKDRKVIQFISDNNNAKNHCINDGVITAYINEYTKFYDVNKNELTNYKLMDLKDGIVDVILSYTTFKNKFGKFERLSVRQLRIIEKTEHKTLFDECLF